MLARVHTHGCMSHPLARHRPPACLPCAAPLPTPACFDSQSSTKKACQPGRQQEQQQEEDEDEPPRSVVRGVEAVEVGGRMGACTTTLRPQVPAGA